MPNHPKFHRNMPFDPTGFLQAYSLPSSASQQPQAPFHHLAPERFQPTTASHTGTSQMQLSLGRPVPQGYWASPWAGTEGWAAASSASTSLMDQMGPSNMAPPQPLRLAQSHASGSFGYAGSDEVSASGPVSQFYPSMTGPDYGSLHCGEPSTSQHGHRPLDSATGPNTFLPLQPAWLTTGPSQPVESKEPSTPNVEYGNKYQQLLASKLLDAPVSLPTEIAISATFGQIPTQEPIQSLPSSNRYEQLVNIKMAAKSSTMEGTGNDGKRIYHEMAQFRKSLLEDGCGMMDSGSVPTMARTNAIAKESEDRSNYSNSGASLGSSQFGQQLAEPLPDISPFFEIAQSWSSRPVAHNNSETDLTDYLPQPLPQDNHARATAEITSSYYKAFGFSGAQHGSIGHSSTGSEIAKWPVSAPDASRYVERLTSSSRSDSFPDSTPKPIGPNSWSQSLPLHAPKAVLPTARPPKSPTPESPVPPLLIIRVHEKAILPPSASDLREANVTPVIRAIPSSTSTGTGHPSQPSQSPGRMLAEPGHVNQNQEPPLAESNMFTEAQVVKKRGRPRKDEISLQSSFGAFAARRNAEAEENESEGQDSESDSDREEVYTKDGKKRKRNNRKTPIACNFCRTKKLKCNGARPICSVCARRNEGGCVFETALRRRGLAKTRKPPRIQIPPLSVDTPLPDFVLGSELPSGISAVRYDFPTPVPKVLRDEEHTYHHGVNRVMGS
ncbi:hypothetical protein IAR50_000059 [Cryptococcus sp. DSM 104548]